MTIAVKKLHFSAEGYGAKGQHNYGFVLDFHSSVNPEVRFIMYSHTSLEDCGVSLTFLSADYIERTVNCATGFRKI